MAQTLSFARPMAGLPDPEPGVLPEWRQLAFPPKGMDNYTRPVALDLATVSDAQNVTPWVDGWRQRNATDLVGSVSSTPILYAYRHQLASGDSKAYRWTTTGVEELTGTSWTALSGPALTATTYDGIALTQWGDLLLFSNGKDGLLVLTPSTRTYAVVAGAPSAVHLATFNRRVMASVPNSGRVQWCVAGDYTDWTSTNLGAGYEDLLASPGGVQDVQSAVIPVSDDVAHAWRGASVWQVSPTRQVGAPFAFSRLVSGVGSRWPKTCVGIPGGSAGVSDDRVWVMTAEGPKDISVPIRGAFRGLAQSLLRRACATYDAVSRSLLVHLPSPGISGSTLYSNATVFRYSMETGTWTSDVYGHGIRAMSGVGYRNTLTIGQLSGTIGSLLGVVGDLGVSDYQSGVLMVSGEPHPSAPTTHFVIREAPDLNGDATTSGVTSVGGTRVANAVPCQWTTAVVRAEDPSRWVHLHEMEVTYTQSIQKDAFLLLEMETDNSGVWTTLFYGQVLTGTGVQPPNMPDKVLRIPLNQQVYHPRLRMQVQQPSHFQLVDWRIRVSDGARRSEHT